MTSRFADLLAGLDVTRASGDPNVAIEHVGYDSREAVPGSLFVALRGGYTDGHRFLDDARRRGAIAALVESWEPALDGYTAAAAVRDTRAALPTVAARYYDHPSDAVGMIGITGTDGKTTTSYMVDGILRSAGWRTGLIGTVAVRIADELVEHDTRQTTPESLEVQRLLAVMRASAVDWAILEATSHGLALHRLDACGFDVGVVTNITHEHLEFHGTIAEYRRAKSMLLSKVAGSRRGRARGVVLNADDAGARSVAGAAGDAPVLWFSSGGHPPGVPARGTRNSGSGPVRPAEIRASDIESRADGTRFVLTTPGGRAEVALRLIGRFNVDNALAAAGVGHIIGLSPGAIADGLATLEGVPGRLRRIVRGQPFSVVVDYAHTPDSLEQTLRLVHDLVTGPVIAVFGSAGERDRTKRPLQGAVSARLAEFSIFTSEDPRFEDADAIIAEIAAGAAAVGAVEGRDFLRIEDRRQAIREALRRAEPGGAVVLAGKGHEQCIIYGAERRPWDEATEAMRALDELGFHA